MENYRSSIIQLIVIACGFLAFNLSTFISGESSTSSTSSTNNKESALKKMTPKGIYNTATIKASDTINFSRALADFKDWYQYDFKQTSGVRSVEENKKVGGSSNSLHLQGLAVDFSLPSEYKGWSKTERDNFWNSIATAWKKILSKYDFSTATSGYGSVERTNDHVHLDTGFASKKYLWLWGDNY